MVRTKARSQYFTYLQNCATGSLNVVEGDAQLNLETLKQAITD